MDHIHKALIGPGFALTSPLKRKPSSCGVCRLRFNSEVGGSFKVRLFFHTHALTWQLNCCEDLPSHVAVLMVSACKAALLNYWVKYEVIWCLAEFFFSNYMHHGMSLNWQNCKELHKSHCKNVEKKLNVEKQRKKTYIFCSAILTYYISICKVAREW